MKKRFLLSLFAFFSAIFSGEGLAATAVIDAVQMPAWLERADRVQPLLPGQQVLDGDRVRTGQGARAYIKLPEGSTVKLGEGALLTYQSATQQDSIFKAALNVAIGAFRFTTGVARKLQKRNIDIRVGNATIGIRGTDVWGRSGKDGDLVMLIEGHVEVQPAQGEAVHLTQSMDEFTAPKGGAANPLQKASWDQFKQRARETDIEPGDGAARSGGKVRLLLGTFDVEQKSLELYDRARAAGFAVKIRPIKSDRSADSSETADYRFEVSLSGFSSNAEAAVASASLKNAGIDVDKSASTSK